MVRPLLGKTETTNVIATSRGPSTYLDGKANLPHFIAPRTKVTVPQDINRYTLISASKADRREHLFRQEPSESTFLNALRMRKCSPRFPTSWFVAQ